MSKADGRYISIKFTEAITSSLDAVYGYAYRPLTHDNVTTLNQYDANTGPLCLKNGLTTDYWRGTSTVNWIQVRLNAPKIATGFRWYIGNAAYRPLTFTVSGSDDGIDWLLLSGTLSGTATIGWQVFSFENSTKYEYYRIDILTTQTASRVYIYELELMANYGLETSFTITGQQYDMQPGGQLIAANYKVDSVESYIAIDDGLDLEYGVLTDVVASEGVLRLAVAE